MIIGYDAKRVMRNGTGLGAYGRTLVRDMSQLVDADTSLLLYAPDSGREEFRTQVEGLAHVDIRYPSSRKSWLGKALWRSCGVVKDLAHDHVDVYHGLSGELPMGISRRQIKTVVTIHDLIFMRHPEFYHWIDAKIYAAKFRATCKEADRIIAISECTKRDIMHYGGVDERKIDLVYQGCGVRFKQRASDEKLQEVKNHYTLPDRYVINVGTIEARKNVLQAVKAVERLPEEVSLVIVGRPTSYADKVKAYVSAHRMERRVRFLHGVPSEDLPALYQQAEACVYPSVYEGFGIPIIEAIQSGLPVVACTGSCLEEAGGADNLYVAPGDVEAMAHALSLSLRGAEGREQRIDCSKEYVRRFENTSVAKQVLAVYERLMTEHS